jgi:hypothetical protein
MSLSPTPCDTKPLAGWKTRLEPLLHRQQYRSDHRAVAIYLDVNSRPVLTSITTQTTPQ